MCAVRLWRVIAVALAFADAILHREPLDWQRDLQLVWDHNILVIWLHAGLVEDVPVRWYNGH